MFCSGTWWVGRMMEGSAVPELRSFPTIEDAVCSGGTCTARACTLTELPRGPGWYACLSAQSAPLALA